jgi:aminoglycoside phosphotransferase family enzyme/predicted kinase
MTSGRLISQAGDIPEALDAALRDPSLYPHPVTGIEVEETHISKVFLTGPFVYKVKKPVDFGFVDFSTPEKRRHWCGEELLLNQRLSHGVYLEVVSITKEPLGFALNGTGEPIEYAVKMRQLPRERSMAELCRQGQLTVGMVEELARVLAHFYEEARSGPEVDAMGSQGAVEAVTEENFTQTEPFVSDLLPRERFLFIRDAVREFLRRHGELFQRRVDTGRVRDGHGDLRLDHVYFVNGIQIIDCIEFNERFRCGDVAADLAFLAMDLDLLGWEDLGWNLIRAYAYGARDPEVWVLLDFYKCYRAYVRCKVECLRLSEGGMTDAHRAVTEERARRAFNLAHHYAGTFSRPTLWVICGLSGSGKSTIADRLANCLRLPVHRSDALRKRLFRASSVEGSTVTAFGEGIYTREATEKTYDALLSEAMEDLASGGSAIVDATFAKRRYRERARNLARDKGAAVVFVECVSHDAVIRRRLTRREGRKDLSDARDHHFASQRLAFEPVTEMGHDEYVRVRTDQPLVHSMEQLFSLAYLCQVREAKGATEK